MKRWLVTIALGAAMLSTQALAQDGAGERGGRVMQDMTRAQAQQRADMMFQRFDLNHDGTVTRQEAEQARAALGFGGQRVEKMIAQAFGDAQSLTDNELYAVVAYLLYLNDIVDENFTLSKASFGQVRMPNEAGFFDDDRETTEKAFWNPRPCMTQCKNDVKIISRARALDVTPQDSGKPARPVE